MDNLTPVNGTPVNTKSLLAFIFNTMRQLAHKEITPNEACSQAKLASQASNLLNYELKRAVVQMRLAQVSNEVEVYPQIREIESKPFDNKLIKTE